MKLLLVLISTLPFLAQAQTFPKDFEWCVATAGHQIEGDNIYSDWWHFELKPGAIKNGERSGKASFHIERMEEDVKIMKDLGVKTYRFSIEWSRIEPKQGEFDETAVAHYRRELELLEKAGIRPMVTIHHFVSPQWFAAGGGWRRPDAPELFLRYVKKLDQEFGNKVSLWVTFNEPTVLLIGGYGEGFFPPAEKSWKIWEPAINILKSHALAYRHLHEKAKARGEKIQVGLAHHLRPVESPQWLIKKGVGYANALLNWSLPEALNTGVLHGFEKKDLGIFSIPWPARIELPEIKGTQDFLGINYYTREHITVGIKKPFLFRDPFPGLEASELYWGLDPEGFYEVFKEAHKRFPKLPFYVTENGLADSKDRWRSNYLVSHLKQMYRAMKELNHPIQGYCHWSLLDNFEWHEGFTPRFGLFEVDYANGGIRRPRPSAEVARRIFRTNSL
jgi:beta-glucosidase